VNGLSEVAHIAAGDTNHADATVPGEIDVMLVHELVHLRRRQTGIAEHSNLIGDVLPVALRTEILQVIAKLAPHSDDAIGHVLDLLAPQRAQLRIVQDRGDHTSTVNRRIRVHRANENLQLALENLRTFLRLRDERERTDALAVETKVLGKRLANQGSMTISQERIHRSHVTLRIARCEALIRRIEEHEMLAILADLGELLPLLDVRVNAGRVVRASVQQNDRSLGRVGDILSHSLEIETSGRRVVVAILLPCKTCIRSDRNVVGPRGIRHVDRRSLGQPALEEVRCNTKSSGTRESLDRGETLGLDDFGILAKKKLGCCVGEIGGSTDGRVLVVQVRCQESFLRLNM
jgi:hypothetical protein